MKFLMCLFLIVACAYLPAEPLKGKIVGSMYHSPNHLFSLVIPQKTKYREIADNQNESVSSVTFLDHEGWHFKVELYKIDPEIFPYLQQEHIFTEFVNGLFDDIAKGNDNVNDQRNKVVIERKVFQDPVFGNLFFGSIRIPSGSDFYCIERGNSCDAVQGILYSIESGHLILITTQLPPVAVEIQKFMENLGQKTKEPPFSELLQKSLMEVRHSIIYYPKESK